MIFDDVLTAKIEAVAHLLGNGWIINTFKTDPHRVNLKNQNQIGASICFTFKKDRLNIFSFAESRNARHRQTVSEMTASPDRKIASLATEIKKRLLDGLAEAVEKCNAAEEKDKSQKTDIALIQEAIKRMVPKSSKGNYHPAISEFSTQNGRGTLKEPYSSGYRLDLSDLKIETVFKIIALLNQPPE